MSQVADDPLDRRPRGRRPRRLARGVRHAQAGPVRARTGTTSRCSPRPSWWLGNLDEAIGLRERAHARFLKQGDKLRAAQIALVLSGDFFGKADLAVSQGWFAKAERLLEGEPESLEHGYLALFQGLNSLATDLAFAIEKAEAAHEIATRFESPDLQALALVDQGPGARPSGRRHRGARAPRRGDRIRRERRAAAALDRVGLLRDHHLVQRRRRLPPRVRVDDGGEALVRRHGRQGLPRRLPRSPRDGQAPPGRLGRRRGAGGAGLRGAPGLRRLDDRGRLLRDRRDPPAPRRLRGRRGVVPPVEGMGPRPAAGARAPAARPGEGRRGRVRDHARDGGGRRSDQRDPAAAGADRDLARGRRSQDRPRGGDRDSRSSPRCSGSATSGRRRSRRACASPGARSASPKATPRRP